jgi:calcyclin binding protein
VKGDRITLILPKAKGGHWDHISKADALKAQLKKEKTAARSTSDDPSAGIMDLMKTMYDEGDDEMKRYVNMATY